MSTTPKLRPLFSTAASRDASVNVLLIPGIGTPVATDWSVVKENQGNGALEYFVYDYHVSLSNNFTWLRFLELGLPLAEQLAGLQSRAENRGRSFVFICHSLGGIILKQALVIANAQTAYRDILWATAAVVFLGTPHSTRDEVLLSERTQLIVRALAPNISRKCLTCLGDECFHVKDILLLFEDIDIRFDVLSVYESIESKVKKGQFIKRSRLATLVDKQLATIQARTETCLGVECEHSNLCSTASKNVQSWLKNALETAASRTERDKTASTESESNESIGELVSRMSSVVSVSSGLGQRPQPDGAHASTDPAAGSSTAQGFDILPVVNNFQTTMKSAQLPCFMVESRLYNKDFWGREDILDTLDDVLVPKAGTSRQAHPSNFARPTHLTLYGQGGLGKSEIAIQFVFTRKDKFDAIFWVRADDTGKLEEDFGNIARQLGLEDPNAIKNPVASRELAKGWLANPRKMISSGTDVIGQAEASWLIVFDNLDDSEILEEYWPIFGGGSILVTSRDPSAKDRMGTGGTSVDMRPLSEEGGAQLFQRLAHRPNESDEIARDISKELGGLPLAIAQMAGIVRYQQLGFSEFLGRYRDWSERSDWYDYSVGGRISLRRGTIASVFALDHLSKQAQILLHLCSVLDPDCIQEDLFVSYSTKSGRLEHFPDKSFHYASARTELLRCSLIQRNENSKEFSLHRLVQDAVKATLAPDYRKLLIQSATELIAAAWGITEIHRRHIKEVWSNREALYPHVLNVKNLFEAWRPDIGWPDIDFAALLNEAGWFQHERGNQPICKAFCEAARAIILHETPDIHESGAIDDRRYDLLCDILYAQGALANESNDALSCMEHNSLFVQMRQRAAKIRDAPDVRLALSHNQYAVACMMADRTEEAIESFLTSIKTYRSLSTYEKGMDSNPILNVGFAYWLKGDLKSALEILTAGLKDRESVFGYMDSVSYHTGRFHHALGNVKLDEGFPTQSEKYHKNALLQYQSSIGEFHHKTADVCHRVAQHCLARDEHESAERLIDQALRAWNMQPASYGPEIARTTFLKARLREGQKQLKEAARLREEAATRRTNLTGSSATAVEALEETDFDELVTFWSR